MEYREAITILIKMLDKYSLDAKEKEAVLTALGVLDWAALGKNRVRGILKARKAKRNKSIE